MSRGERVSRVGHSVFIGSELNTTGVLAENTAEISRVAAEAVELFIDIEENGGELFASPTVPCGAFLFRAQSTLSSVSSKTKH